MRSSEGEAEGARNIVGRDQAPFNDGKGSHVKSLTAQRYKEETCKRQDN